MPTFIIKSKPDFSDPIQLDTDDIYHLTKVLRTKAGETLQLTNNNGLLATVTVEATEPLKLKLIETHAAEAVFDFTVCLPMIEKKRLEWCIEKLTELNVKTIQLIKTARTQPFGFADSYLLRLKDLAKSAQKQCGRGVPLEILSPVDLKELLFANPGSSFFASLLQTEKHIAQATTKPTASLVIVGPEGGFTPEEEDFLIAQKLQPIHLGQTVLRAETACIALTSLFKFNPQTE